MTTYREVDAKSIARASGLTDPWFLARYGANLYRGCEHGCLYCDGRAEKYQVTGRFAEDIQVKRNALDLLDRELARLKEPGFFLIGGGVCDAYQPAEERFRLARGALELALRLGLPVHVLTKSALVERDLDLLERINSQRRAILSFSLQTTDDTLRSELEPRAAPIEQRWRLLAQAKQRGLATGVMAMPLLPGLSDQPERIRALLTRAKACGVDFVCFGGLTLRPGVQHDVYWDALRERHPELLDGYTALYRAKRPSGAPDPRYLGRLAERCRAALAELDVAMRPPRWIFSGLVPRYTEVALLLEHDEARAAVFGSPGSKTGWTLQKWAHAKLARLRGPRAFREVEAAFDLGLKTGSLRRELHLDESTMRRVVALARGD